MSFYFSPLFEIGLDLSYQQVVKMASFLYLWLFLPRIEGRNSHSTL